MSKPKPWPTRAEIAAYWRAKNKGGALALGWAVIIFAYAGGVAYEVFEPQFYLESRSSRIIPYLIWIFPPLIVLLFLREVKLFAASTNNLHGEDDA